MSPWWRRERPKPYSIAECTATPDQGVVEAWISRRGRPVLCCDVCHAVWYDPGDLDLATYLELNPSGALPNGDGFQRPASREELRELGWWGLVHPLSRAVHSKRGLVRPYRGWVSAWRPGLPVPYWLGECSSEDQGLIVAWVTRAGTPVLFCDVCYRAWDDPRDLDPATIHVLPDSGEWNGERLDRPATREELRELGWWELVHPLSASAWRPPPPRPA